MMRIKAEKIFLEDKIVNDSALDVDNGLIVGITHEVASPNLSCHTLIPGFIDIHIHGCGGFDTMDATYEALNEISRCKLKEGVIAFHPTIVTSDLDKISTAMQNVDMAINKGVTGAEILGVFLEGPYICEKYKGAHPAEFIRDINIDEIETLISKSDNVKSLIVAPEKENALEMIRLLKDRGINVRIGHSEATAEIIDEAIRYGANIAVHTFNAMSPFTHREPGMVGAVMSNDDVYAEIINDFVHVSPRAVEILYRLKGPEKMILVTDCMMAGGLPDGSYRLGELPVEVKNKTARTLTGALAGSTLAMIDAVKNMVKLNVSLFDAVKMATLTPARAMNIDNVYGSILPGKKASLVGLDENLNISFVLVNGEIRHSCV